MWNIFSKYLARVVKYLSEHFRMNFEQKRNLWRVGYFFCRVRYIEFLTAHFFLRFSCRTQFSSLSLSFRETFCNRNMKNWIEPPQKMFTSLFGRQPQKWSRYDRLIWSLILHCINYLLLKIYYLFLSNLAWWNDRRNLAGNFCPRHFLISQARGKFK